MNCLFPRGSSGGQGSEKGIGRGWAERQGLSQGQGHGLLLFGSFLGSHGLS